MKRCLLRVAALLVLCTISLLASARTLELQTTEVTSPDVALSPDGQTLVFTMLGHLFSGGTAEQLTFGPYNDNDPVFSPDGSQLAFTSDRGRSDREELAGAPTWRPDGKSIIYLHYANRTPKGMP